jgi:hypothetical protein
LGSLQRLRVAICWDSVLSANDSIDFELNEAVEDQPCATANICDT